MSILSIKSVTRQFEGRENPAVNNFSLELQKNTLLALVGHSGSGKTTILRMIAGLEIPDSGKIELAGRTMVDENVFIQPEKRGVGLLFQEYALFPHMSVSDNIGYGLHQLSKAERQDRIQEMLELTQLESHEKRYPHELSGGEQQRVALARAIAPNPSLLLLDEPFSNLDAHLKNSVRDELCNIIRSSGISTILVTHDTGDALAIADKVAVIHNGHLEQLGGPQGIYEKPNNEYVAKFFGASNLVSLDQSGKQLLEDLLAYSGEDGNALNGRSALIRPADIIISATKPKQSTGVRATVIHRTFQGQYCDIIVETLGTPSPIKLILHCPSKTAPLHGEEIRIHLQNREQLHILHS